MAETTTPESKDAPAGESGSPGLLFNRFEVDPEQPLPAFDRAMAQAFAARDRRNPDRDLYGLVCAPGVPYRSTVVQILKGDQPPGVLPLAEWGPMAWPAHGGRCMTLIYERPRGGSLAEGFTGDQRVTEYDMPRRVIEPILHHLGQLAALGVAHRAIRPDNLFFMDEGKRNLVLGECAALPPGFDQPTIYEPIDRAMASPAGRGEGETADDLYALAVTLVVLLLGRSPAAKIGDENVLMAKIEKGSYAALCGRERIPMALIEPLRGMMSDNVAERWTLTQLDLWVNGRKLTPIQRKPAQRAHAPLNFAGRDHVTLGTVARALSRNVRDAARLIRDGQLESWLRRSFGDAGLADVVAEYVEVSRANQGDPRGSEDFLVTRVVFLLDPSGPVRYKGFSFMIDSFGPALAVALLNEGQAQAAAETIAYGVPAVWIASQPPNATRYPNAERQFVYLHGVLQSNLYGQGIERCLYETNRSLACRSPLIADAFVDEIRDLLPALDQAATRFAGEGRPIDRHIAAFIVTHFSQDLEPHMAALSDGREDRSLIGMLSVLALLQWRLKVPPVFGLSSWIGGLLGPVTNTYYSRFTRRDIEREIPRLVRQGSLPELYDLIENADRRRGDREGYALAVAEFATAEAEIQDMESGEVAIARSSLDVGRQVAAMISVVFAMVAVGIAFLIKVW